MKTRTRIGAMILVLALFLCTIPVGAETETRVVVQGILQKKMQTAAADEKLEITIWLPQVDWGYGEGIKKYVGKIVSETMVYHLPDEQMLYNFFDRTRSKEQLIQHADVEWFIREYGIVDHRLYAGEIVVNMTVTDIQNLIDKNPDAFLSFDCYAVGVERLPMHHTGDANEDEVVDSRDARLVLQYAVGKVTHPRFIHLYEADINGDNTVDSADARQILQKAVGTF